MEPGILKSILLFLPIVAYLVWQIVALNRDPELKSPARSTDDSDGAARSTETGHSEGQ